MNMSLEVTFRLQNTLTEELENQLIETYDAFVGGHGDVTLLTVGIPASDSPRQAVLNTANQLFRLGILLERIEKDLVSAATIAKRCSVSRAAVGNWIRGDRLADTNFPQAYALSPQAWRWADVNTWLRATGKDHDDVTYLTLDDEAYVDYQLLTTCRAELTDTSPWKQMGVVTSTESHVSNTSSCMVQYEGAFDLVIASALWTTRGFTGRSTEQSEAWAQ